MAYDKLKTARAYHLATRHQRGRIEPHFPDFDHYPRPFKTYEGAGGIAFNQSVSAPLADLDDVFNRPADCMADRIWNLSDLRWIAWMAYGVTASQPFGKGRFYSRTVPSAGGLYPCHLYLVVRRGDTIETGVYYIDLIQAVLVRIRSAEFPEDESNDPALSWIITGMLGTSAWKYRNRAYRYILLDAGHLSENLRLAMKAADMPYSADINPDYDGIETLLALDTDREVPLVVLHAGSKAARADGRMWAMRSAMPPCRPEIRDSYLSEACPVLKNIYEVEKRTRGRENFPSLSGHVLRDHGVPGAGVFDPDLLPSGSIVPDRPAAADFLMDYASAVVNRRSHRRFGPEILDQPRSVALLQAAAGFHRQALASGTAALSLLRLGICVEHVNGFADGFYLLTNDAQSFVRIRKGRFQAPLSRVCLDQQWISGAAVNFLFMVNLNELEQTAGPGGYSAVLMHAGGMAQRIYLAATGLGLGCCGVGALYDDEAGALFELNPDSALFYVVSAGTIRN